MPRTIYCRCAYAQIIPGPVKDAHLKNLCESGEAFDAVPDLCEMAANRHPKLKEIAQEEEVRIVACHPRAVKGLFTQAGCPLPATADIINMREQTAP